LDEAAQLVQIQLREYQQMYRLDKESRVSPIAGGPGGRLNHVERDKLESPYVLVNAGGMIKNVLTGTWNILVVDSWNSGMTLGDDLANGTTMVHLSSDLNYIWDYTKAVTINTYNYTLNTPITNQFYDAGSILVNAISNPVTYENLAIGWILAGSPIPKVRIGFGVNMEKVSFSATANVGVKSVLSSKSASLVLKYSNTLNKGNWWRLGEGFNPSTNLKNIRLAWGAHPNHLHEVPIYLQGINTSLRNFANGHIHFPNWKP
jgi:hypothetical protein